MRTLLKAFGTLLAATSLLTTVGCREAAKSTAAPALSESASNADNESGVQKLNVPKVSAEDERWNSRIAWLSMDDAFAVAKRDGKPIVLIFYTEWCPHCRNYAKVFHDPSVVEASEGFVMVRVDEDAAPHLGVKWKPDGGYVPRTFFLSPQGHMDVDLVGPNPRFKHFLNENSPDKLVALMSKARRKFAR